MEFVFAISDRVTVLPCGDADSSQKATRTGVREKLKRARRSTSGKKEAQMSRIRRVGVDERRTSSFNCASLLRSRLHLRLRPHTSRNKPIKLGYHDSLHWFVSLFRLLSQNRLSITINDANTARTA